MLRLKDIKIVCSKEELAAIPNGKVLINTINAHSYNTAQKDELFAEALKNGDALIPDGASVVKACRWLKAKYQPKERIAGWDLFEYEMGKQEERGKRKEEGEHQTPKSPRQVGLSTRLARIFMGTHSQTKGYVHGFFGEGAGHDKGEGEGGVSAS